MENKTEEIEVNKAAIKIIHADGFFPENEAENCCAVVRSLNFVDKPYGKELERFSLILPGMDPIFSKMLGEEVVIDESRSGIFRKPLNLIVRFEDFRSLNEWCFVVALEKTSFNIYQHVKDIRYNENLEIDAKTVLDGHEFNYRNFFEWDIVTSVILEPNQGIFFRPWCFHSFEDGLIQYYRLIKKD